MGPSSKRTVPFRFQYPSEIELNRLAKTAALRAWSELGLQIVPLLAKKTAYFLLSADQLFKTHSLSGRRRKIRTAGVFIYWSILASAILGWVRVRRIFPRLAILLLPYCILATLLHLPFTMNTRLRAPLLDSILAFSRASL